MDNNRRDFLKQSIVAAAGLGCLSLRIKAQLSVTDKPDTHNMLVFGEQTVFLSHLPMFHKLSANKKEFTSPHRYQVILEATFTDGEKNLTEIYTADRKAHPAEKMYTINPAEFVLPDLDAAGAALKTFRGNAVFRGHLERESQSIIGSTQPPGNGVFDVNVQKVVHFRKFDPGAGKPKDLEYLLFGKDNETFMAHFIAQPPDFDQVISVKVGSPTFSPDELSNGIRVSFARKNTAMTRLKEKQKASGVTQPVGMGPSKQVQVEVLREIYFEEGELRVPHDFAPTPEERRSGFGD